MALRTALTKQVFHFNFQARTSRGAMRERTSWFVKVWDEKDPEVFGLGECAPLPGLSVDDVPDYEERLKEVLQGLEKLAIDNGHLDSYRETMDNYRLWIDHVVSPQFPSIIFGLETALLDLLNGGKRIVFKNDFQTGRRLPINGLIWMADMDLMLQQIAIKISDGYRCIKMKVGGLNFEKECDILAYIRKKYFRDDITIRLDANGAFKPEDCLYKLKELSKFNIHSLEQPIKPGQVQMLRAISEQSPIPIALDEELIGVYETAHREKLLSSSKVPYLILKPSLHGGLQSCREWIRLAENKKMNWWITSALESNVGLNAICQLTAEYPISIPQGLGTGQLYDDNIESPLFVKSGEIGYNPNGQWDLSSLLF